MRTLSPFVVAAGLALASPAPAQLPAPTPPSYAQLAARVIAAPVLADVQVRRATRIKGAEAAALPPNRSRFYVEADVLNLLRAPETLPPRIGYVVDVDRDATGRLPKLKGMRVLLFARPVPGRPGSVQLAGPEAQRPWSPALDATVRRIAMEVVQPDSPPTITGIGSAFHVAGTLPGEGETQIFLSTADGRPVSLSVLRRPGQPRQWAVALSEFVDAAARPPAPETLLWYRLACFLPPRLPDASIAAIDREAAFAAREDYQFVVEQLGRCDAPAAPATY